MPRQIHRVVKYAKVMLAEPGLFQSTVGGVTRLKFAVDVKVAHRPRVDPDLVDPLPGLTQ
jgi:hypothetical protein